jgi:hypothetical protein
MLPSTCGTTFTEPNVGSRHVIDDHHKQPGEIARTLAQRWKTRRSSIPEAGHGVRHHRDRRHAGRRRGAFRGTVLAQYVRRVERRQDPQCADVEVLRLVLTFLDDAHRDRGEQ